MFTQVNWMVCVPHYLSICVEFIVVRIFDAIASEVDESHAPFLDFAIQSNEILLFIFHNCDSTIQSYTSSTHSSLTA